MPCRRSLVIFVVVLILYVGIGCLSLSAFSQVIPSDQAHDPFKALFDELATTQAVEGSRSEKAYIKLMDSIATLTPAEITKGIQIINLQLDSKAEPEDRLAKADAAYLLTLISWRPDGPQLLASEVDRLTFMLNDPSHLLSGPAAMALQHIGDSRPDVVVTILEAALKDPEVNNPTGIGPGIAVILLRMAPRSEEATKNIVQYMQRPDLTDNQLISTIVGIDSSRFIPDAITTELVRCLDRSNQIIKGRALVGIAKSSPAAKDAARVRMQRMVNDPGETAHIRRLAAEALEGQISENPDVDK